MAVHARARFVAAAALALSLAGCVDEGGREMSLQQYQWESRLLLVFAPSPGEAGVAEQRRKNADRQAEFPERDLLEGFLYETAPGTIGGDVASTSFSAEARQRLDIRQGAFVVVLVGKDGSVKFRSDRPVRPEHIFDLIDAMPMRREEMRRQRGG